MDVSVHKMFPTPLLRIKFSKHSEYDFSELKKAPEANTNPPDGQSNVNTSYKITGSEKSELVDETKMEALKADIFEQVKDAVCALDMPAPEKMSYFWYNVYLKGQTHALHHHMGNPANYWCGVYAHYGLSQENSTHFVSPAETLLCAWGMEGSQTHEAIGDCFIGTGSIPLEDGDIILFPPYLLHYAPTNDSDKPKITFAFNIAKAQS